MKEQEWEKEFDVEKYVVYANTTRITDDGGESFNQSFMYLTEELRLAIKQALTSQKQSFIEIVDGMRKNFSKESPNLRITVGYNQALSDIKSKLDTL